MTVPSDYLDEVAKYITLQDADEGIMRVYEESHGIPEQSADDFRRNVLAVQISQGGDDEGSNVCNDQA